VSNHLGTKKLLDLLENVRAVARECVTAEEKLTYEFRLKVGRERQTLDALLSKDTAELAASIASAEESFQAASAGSEAKYTQRKNWINRARASSKEQFLTGVEDRAGLQKHKLQKELLEAQAKLESALAQVNGTFENSSKTLVAENEALDALQNRCSAAIRGHYSIKSLMAQVEPELKEDLTVSREKLHRRFKTLFQQAEEQVKSLSRNPLSLLFRFIPVYFWLPLCAVPLALAHFNLVGANLVDAGLVTLVLLTFLFILGKVRLKKPSLDLAKSLAAARKVYAACLENSAEQNRLEIQTLNHLFETESKRIDVELSKVQRESADYRASARERIDTKTVRIVSRNERKRQARLSALDSAHAQKLKDLNSASENRRSDWLKYCSDQESAVNRELAERWNALQERWHGTLDYLKNEVSQASEECTKLCPAWSPEVLENWRPPNQFVQQVRYGGVKVELSQLCEALPKDPRLAIKGSLEFSAPLQLTHPDQGSILFETGNTGRDEAVGVLNNLIFRLLMLAPPGRISFTILDPVGLGQNFSGVMHLADYGERLINNRIWTQPAQIEEKLGELNDHMEKVIQMYLRNEYETIAEYNAAAGNIAERYHFLVVADFPSNFSELAVKRLQSIATSGARCGVYSLIHWDTRIGQPEGFVPEVVRKSNICLTNRGGTFSFTGRSMPGLQITMDPQPDANLATGLIHKIGEASRDSSRVEVPFSHVAPTTEEALWSLDATQELRVSIGRTGATKLQYAAIGRGTRQHALVAGKTGSGKSTLFHVMITNLALWYSPEQVEFYLVDFKKGVEFKCYASKLLPHARVVAIESDREFGLSVLQRVDEELKRRGELFRKLGVQDLPGYKRESNEPMPRTLLMIDEFQELFVEDDKISQEASLLLDRIVRQGRAFGIHVILGSQTLGGAYTVARTTLGQMVIRIALQCNEADAYLIMDDSNPAPRLLTRPGEGIYNDSAGALAGNSPFQTVWLPDDVRDQFLDRVLSRESRSSIHHPGPLVYEGDAPGNILENTLLAKLLETTPSSPPAAAHIWLGSPNAIKGPTEADFHRQSGNNLLIIGQRDEAILGILSIALLSLSAQYPRNSVRFYVLDSSPPGSSPREYLEQVIGAVPHPITLVKGANFLDMLTELKSEMQRRIDNEHGAGDPSIFLLINGIQRFNKLRHEETFGFSSDDEAVNPGQILNEIICEGASMGIHVIVACDTYNNVNRFFGKKAFSEFEMRVLFQMSASDSASICDSPRAGSLGLHRALFYNEQEGYLETFRPYSLPEQAWVVNALKNQPF